MLIRILGLAVIIFLFTKGMNLGREQLNFIMNLTKSTLVTTEVKSISRTIYTDLVITNDYTVPAKSEIEWREFIREHSHTEMEKRDPTKDMFGTHYRVQAVDNSSGTGGKRGFEVRSAGPDKEFGTNDDIVAKRVWE